VRRAASEFDATTRAAQKLGIDGLGRLIGLTPELERGLARVAASSRGLGTVMATLGPVTIAAAAAMASWSAAQRLRPHVEGLLGVEALRRELEQFKGLDKELNALTRERIIAESALAALQSRARGDELGAARAVAESKAQILAIEIREKRAALEKDLAAGKLGGEHLVAAERGWAAQRLAITQELTDKRRAIEATALADRVKHEQSIIDDILEATKKAEEARESIRAGAVRGAKGLGIEGSIFEGFEDVEKVKKDLQGVKAGMEDAVRRGLLPTRDAYDLATAAQLRFDTTVRALTEKFKEQPAVLRLINDQLGKFEFGGFARELDASVRSIQGLSEGAAKVFDATTGALEAVVTGTRGFNQVLISETPAALNAVRPAIHQVTGDIANLHAWLVATRQATRDLNNELAGQ
jgi:hypothetical protein